MSVVSSLTAHRVIIPLARPFVTAVRSVDSLTMVAVEATDAQGNSGWGEAAVSRVTSETWESVKSLVDGPFSKAIVGGRLDDPVLLNSLPPATYGTAAARSAVDCAIHDLLAQRSGMSLARFLGASAESVHTDMTLSAGDPTAMAAQAVRHVEAGFDHLKIKVDRNHDPLEMVAAIRSAVGGGITLRVDANQAWTPIEAIEFIMDCEDSGHNLEFVEQPVAADDVAGLARVTAASNTPIVADEAVRTAAQVSMVASRHAADIVNIKLAKTGGLTASLDAIITAKTHGLGIIIGSMLEGPIGVGASAALAAACAPDQVHDLDAAQWLVHSPTVGGARFLGPIIELADAPGLGIASLIEDR